MIDHRTRRGTRLHAAALLLVVAGVLAFVVAAPGEAAAPPLAPAVWHPRKGVTWQWQLDGRINTSVAAQVYDIDAGSSAATVKALHRKGRKVICYISAGSWENWRSDRAKFPARVLGDPLDGWPGERWLDVRQVAVLKPIMAARMDVCRRKGFDGVEPDNVDGYTNDTGFPLTAAQQRTYNLMLAGLAHARGLAVGLKNDTDQVAALQPYFDFAVNEQCAQYDECGVYRAFLRAGKAVLHAEYDLTTAQFCPTSRRLGLSSIRKKLALGAWRQTC